MEAWRGEGLGRTAGRRAGSPDLAALAAGRVHEATGPGRRAFAVAMAGEATGPVLWVIDARRREALHPAGLAPLLDPARLLFARPTGLLAALRTTEEALRSGAVPFVVADLDRGPDLVQSRRLQLAAGAGGARGLCLVPEGGLRASAVETRWHCAPLPTAPASVPPPGTRGGAPQRWELLKNRRGPLGEWEVALGAEEAPPRRAGG